jgi:hypothetical protein
MQTIQRPFFPDGHAEPSPAPLLQPQAGHQHVGQGKQENTSHPFHHAHVSSRFGGGRFIVLSNASGRRRVRAGSSREGERIRRVSRAEDGVVVRAGRVVHLGTSERDTASRAGKRRQKAHARRGQRHRRWTCSRGRRRTGVWRRQCRHRRRLGRAAGSWRFSCRPRASGDRRSSCGPMRRTRWPR